MNFLSGEIRFYKGLYKVKVMTESEGYWIVQALEDFEDCVDGNEASVKAGEQRIVPPNLLFRSEAAYGERAHVRVGDGEEGEAYGGSAREKTSRQWRWLILFGNTCLLDPLALSVGTPTMYLRSLVGRSDRLRCSLNF